MEDQLEWDVVVGFVDGELLHVPCESEEEATMAVKEIYDGMGVPGAKILISDHAAIDTAHVRFAFMHDSEADEEE